MKYKIVDGYAGSGVIFPDGEEVFNVDEMVNELNSLSIDMEKLESENETLRERIGNGDGINFALETLVELAGLREVLEYVKCSPVLDKEDYLHEVIDKALKGD
jgi:hypothetical protein